MVLERELCFQLAPYESKTKAGNNNPPFFNGYFLASLNFKIYLME